MIVEIVGGIVLFGGGFGIGRIKNKGKLSQIDAKLTEFEKAGETDAKKVITSIKAEVDKV